MGILSGLVAGILASVFVVGGVEKLRSRSAFARTLTGLRVPGALVPALAVAVPAAEIATAAGLMLAPASRWPAAGLAGLGTAFAAAGLLSLRSPEPVACSCLGAAGEGYLGRRQVLLLPVWLGSAALLLLAPPAWSFTVGIQLLALAVVAGGGLHAVRIVAAWRNDAAFRRAIEESSEVRDDIVAGLYVIEGTR
jgi:hypothetical protein